MKRIAIVLLAALAISGASAQSAEFGVQLDDRGPAAFGYLTADFSVGAIGPFDIWFSPSVEIIVSQTFIDGWVQAQFLLDSEWATLSARGKAELIDSRQRLEFRLGLLIGR